MFEIGSSLRAARMRQRLELSQAEHDTRIRARYLGALEDERFDVLPGPAYAKGFLRTYADYLGLDAQRFVDEYNTRFAPEEELAAPPLVRIRRRRFAPAAWLLVVVALAASSALVAWRLSSNGGNHATPAPPPAQTRTTLRAAAPRPATHPGDGRSDRARRHARPLLAVRPPGLGDRQVGLRGDARAGSNRAVAPPATRSPKSILCAAMGTPISPTWLPSRSSRSHRSSS
jgi:hypothetical protein